MRVQFPGQTSMLQEAGNSRIMRLAREFSEHEDEVEEDGEDADHADDRLADDVGDHDVARHQRLVHRARRLLSHQGPYRAAHLRAKRVTTQGM